MDQAWKTDELKVVRLSCAPAKERGELLETYRREVYEPAFPLAEIREDVRYWAGLLGQDAPPPQPRLEVVLLTTTAGTIVGGVTIEHYRAADCGLLTYIAVAPDAQARGVGKRLVAEARAALDEMAGTVPMFAETERYCDAADDAERAATVTRQRQLAKLGAELLAFDYVMPPLRPDSQPHSLHLLVFGPHPGTHPPVSTRQVAALLSELAAALGADLEAYAETQTMMRWLEAHRIIKVKPLPATRFDRQFVEDPVFTGLTTATFSFAFELDFDAGGDVARAAIRLEQVQADLEERSSASVHVQLVEPVRSFLDDVTTGPPGRNGRPLLVTCSGTAAQSEDRAITMIRPAAWHYRAEGQRTELVAPHGAERAVPMRLHDAICAFESGRVFYILSLVLPDEGAAIDEYAVLQLEQLALRPSGLIDQVGYLAFDWGGERRTLLELANARIASLAAEDAARPNAIADVLCRFEMARKGERRMQFVEADLKGLCIGIESEELLDVARRATSAFGDDETTSRPRPSIDRELLAFAGIVQGVEDFPFQDESEVHDSTRPTALSIEAAIYAHPRFLIEIGKGWRSYHMARPKLGSCPYLLLTWLVALHDELVVSRTEVRIDEMVYGPGGSKYRPVPLADIATVLSDARKLFGGDTAGLVEANLRRRLDLFRWLTINRSSNVFRYPKERDTLSAVQAAMGTAGRFERANDMVDRIESLVEDASELRSTYAERRTNAMLLIIAVLSVFSVSNDLQGHLSLVEKDPQFFVTVAVLLIVAALAMFRDWKPRAISSRDS
ncbi:MAG: GNAT family N-acetyltransferase [Burkholderiales bacterium]